MKKEDNDIDIKFVWDKMKSGDEQSLSKIFSFFYSDLYHYGIKIFNLPDLVKDSIQDVFVRIWEKRDTIGDVQNPKAYLIASLRRKIFENKEKYFKEVSDEATDQEGKRVFSFEATEFMEVEEVSKQLRNSLVQVINSLPERQRELIFLRFYYNLRYVEIARVMEVKEQTIKNMMQRAISNLRGKIDPPASGWEGIDFMDDLLLTFFVLFRINLF